MTVISTQQNKHNNIHKNTAMRTNEPFKGNKCKNTASNVTYKIYNLQIQVCVTVFVCVTRSPVSVFLLASPHDRSTNTHGSSSDCQRVFQFNDKMNNRLVEFYSRSASHTRSARPASASTRAHA